MAARLPALGAIPALRRARVDPLPANPGLGDLHLVDLIGVDGEDVSIQHHKASLVAGLDQSDPVERRDLAWPDRCTAAAPAAR